MVTDSRVGIDARITHAGSTMPVEWQEKIRWIAEVSEPKEVEVVRECDRTL
ncbi:hypothetical protein NDI34_22870 [Trichocoleus sp. DQ-U1]